MKRPVITVYFGPLHWFDEETSHLGATQLAEHITAIDVDRRTFRVRGEAQEDERERPGHVVATSSDYMTLSEAWLNNFAGLVLEIDPKHLHLQNPPVHVQDQLQRIFEVKVKNYIYPRLDLAALARVRRSFAERVIGQERVRERLLPALYQLTAPAAGKPVVLMLYGPSGVGKTETGRLVNDFLGGKLLRIQFSMYHSEKFASYIFGGSHSERSLAHDLLDRESGVILIDEFDKAHPTFHSAFYEMFDEGVFVDKNYRVDLGPALIICTSNYSSEREVHNELGDALASRFTAMIQYQALSEEAVAKIADQLIDTKYADLSDAEREHVDLDLVRAAIHSHHGFSNVRTIGKTVDEIISHLLVNAALDAQEHDEAEVEQRGPAR